MINRTIKVEYVIRKDNGQVGLTYDDIAQSGEQSWQVEADEKVKTFTKFTNRGKVSKPQLSPYQIINDAAEKQLAQELKVESECETDQQRANQLAVMVSQAFQKTPNNSDLELVDDDADQLEHIARSDANWRTIKVKTSHSQWYTNAGEFNRPSTYFTQVPTTVAEVAKELQAIRKKHEHDPKFNFAACNYAYRTVRIADHFNY